MASRSDALEYHASPPPGKLEVRPTKPCLTQRDLTLAYSPGVAEPCLEIAANPQAVFDYTGKGNLVAVVTNGTAVLGLGNIGPQAGKPVMEGKAVLFKRFAGIDVFDIELDAPDVDTFCNVVRAMAPTFGGINIEDVKAPDCFLIEERLREELDIPVFHDDQHGTAIITCAGLVNALHIVAKKIEDVRIVFSGAGAAALATAHLLLCMGAKRENMLMCDSRGVVRKGAASLEGNPYKARYAADTELETLAQAMEGADVFIGVSVAGIVSREMVRSMAEQPIVFALANPDPEIPYPDVLEERPDAIVATGRSDYPNQVNNVLGFPFIFRGTLDARATTVNEPMMIAAVKALAELAREDVGDEVTEAYGGVSLRFGREYIIPKPLDTRALLRVAPAVALAATLSGVARQPINDIDAYREELERRLGKQREVMRFAVMRAKHQPRRVVFADGQHDKVLRAVAQILEEEIAQPILIGDPEIVRQRSESLELPLLAEIERGRCTVVSPAQSPMGADFEKKIFQRRARKGMTQRDARRLMRTRNWFGAMMVQEGLADGMVCGLGGGFPETLRPLLKVIGTAPTSRQVAGVHLMILRDEIYFFTDTTVNLDPSAEEMAEIASMGADVARCFDVTPRVAMLSFSNFGSVRNERSQKVVRAVDLLRTWRPELEVDGELHADTALMPDMAKSLYPFSRLSGKANVLVFPSLEAGNIAQKIAQCAGAEASIGPILVGLNRAVNIVSPYASVTDIVLTAAITAMMAAQGEGDVPIDDGGDVLRLARIRQASKYRV